MGKFGTISEEDFEKIGMGADLPSARRCFPRPSLTVSEWADKYRRLSPEASAEPGRWITKRAAYQKEMMDSVSDPTVHTVVVMTGSQVGKTELCLNVVGYFIHQDPAPILMVEPRIADANTLSKDRIDPMIRDTPALTDLIAPPNSRGKGNSILHKRFPGGHITLTGANSPAGLAMRPIRVTIFDEVDRYPPSAGEEGDPVSIGKKRSATFWNRKSLLCSSPTIAGFSRIEDAYEESDRREYYVPCPHCSWMQTLRWEQVRWRKTDSGNHLPLSARYHCENCNEPWDDSARWKAVGEGEWKPHPEAEFNGIRGFHLNELYSPWKRLYETVQDFLEAKDKPERYKVWTNTSLGLTWTEQGEAPDHERLYERRELYRRNVVPLGGVVLTAGVDVQGDRLEVEIVAWGFGLESWSVDYRVLFGDPAQDEVWSKLSALLKESFPHESGSECRIARLCVDSGFATHSVYDWRRRSADSRVLVIKGYDKLYQAVGRPNWVEVNYRGKIYKKGVQVWPVGVSFLKNELYSWLRLPKPEKDDDPTPGYCHFPEYDKEHFKQLTAEQLITKYVRGFQRREWKKLHPNEALDARIYARAAASNVGLDNWSEKKWLKAADLVGAEIYKRTPVKEENTVKESQEVPKQPRRPTKKGGWLDRGRGGWFSR